MQYVVAFGNFGAASSISFHIPAAQGQIFFKAEESIGVGSGTRLVGFNLILD